MPRSHQDDNLDAVKVPKECVRISQLFQAKGEALFISENVNVMFPSWNIKKIAEISGEQFVELENELKSRAENGKREILDSY